jgi:hypothetical protein
VPPVNLFNLICSFVCIWSFDSSLSALALFLALLRELGCHCVFAEHDLAEHRQKWWHLEQNLRVSCQVWQSALSRLLVENQLKANCNNRHKQCVGKGELVAYEEVAQPQVLFDRSKCIS